MTITYGVALGGYVRTIHPDTRASLTLITALQSARDVPGAKVVKSENGGRWQVIAVQQDDTYNFVTVSPPHGRLRRLAAQIISRLRRNS